MRSQNNSPAQSQQQNENTQDIYSNQIMIGSDILYEVKQWQMEGRLHKNIVSIIWRNKINVGRGSGILISRNLVLTSAHNLFHPKDKYRIQDRLFEIYHGQCGVLQNPYRIQKCFIPQQYQRSQQSLSIIYDYALIKLSQKVKADDFIILKSGFQNSQYLKQKIAIFGYPASKYGQNHPQLPAETVNQWGLIRTGRILQIRQQKDQIIHSISADKGQSGSPMILIQGQQLSIIGIYKGGITTRINNSIYKVNVGRLITSQLIMKLKDQANKLQAQMFVQKEEELSIVKYKRFENKYSKLNIPLNWLSESLQQVLPNQMNNLLHKNIVSIRSRFKVGNSIGINYCSGILISKNLVLTTAQVLFINQQRFEDKTLQVYWKCGQQLKLYKVQSYYYPKGWQSCWKEREKSIFYDCALLKLSQKVNNNEFIGLRAKYISHDDIKNGQLAIFGYPKQCLKIDGQNKILDIKQQGLIKTGRVLYLKEEKKQIVHCILTKPGQAGSPYILIQNEKLYIIGIHSGYYDYQYMQRRLEAKKGRLITKQIISVWRKSAISLGAEMFIVIQ